MKKIIFLILLLNGYFCNAQNYQCLQSGIKHYFINGNGYLRGIRIDSVIISGDTTIYYPFHTPRGSYIAYLPLVLDSNGGSWLGKKVLQLANGDFIFDSYWNGSVIIRTQANVGDSWIFYRDTSSLYYSASIIEQDTMTILGVVDSIKKILITAMDSSGIVSSDPLDSFQIFLSKNNGFVQVFDLYTFPYHKPYSSYTVGLDYFLDQSTLSYDNVGNFAGNPPSPNCTIFRIANFINPNDIQLHNWNTGNLFEYSAWYGTITSSVPDLTYYDILDSITNTVVSADNLNYRISSVKFQAVASSDTFYVNNDVFYDNNYSIIDISNMPEQYSFDDNFVYYFPNDTSLCKTNPVYIVTSGFGGDISEMTHYKLGLGAVYHLYENFDDAIPIINGYSLSSYKMDSESCDVISVPPDAIININNPVNDIKIFPNPAHDELNVVATGKITDITISNILGQIVYADQYNTEKVQIDVHALSAGIYLVKINDTDVKRFVKE